MERSDEELAAATGLSLADIAKYREIARLHGKPVEDLLAWACRCYQDFMKDGPMAAARKIMEGLEAEGQLTDSDRENFKRLLEENHWPPLGG